MEQRELAAQKEQLDSALRRFGIEADDAFYLLAYHYAVCRGDALGGPPERVVRRGGRARAVVQEHGWVLDMLDSVVALDPSAERLPEWYQHFIGRRFRKGSGKFFTPRPLAAAMAALVPVKQGALVMDPTCGGGTFLVEASRAWGEERCTLVGNDVDESLVDLARMVLHLSAPEHHRREFLVCNVYHPGAALEQLYGAVDCILANPPFSLKIQGEGLQSDLLSLGYTTSDALFLDVCLRLLRPGGRLVCLLPHSIVSNKEFAALRGVAESWWDLLGVISLPEGVFFLSAESSTRADIVVLTKRGRGVRRPREAVFAYAPSVGVSLNSAGSSTVDNQLAEVVRDRRVRRALGLEREAPG
ncbi:MAG TPA: N-6 DNA methylase [Anaerolineae bacterium]|nr:N-6 DNA methylase [Anaerolineae bacterium]